MSCCSTTPYHHTGTTSPTDVGPASGGYLHSITISDMTTSGSLFIKDGGSGGTTILALNGAVAIQQLFWKGLKIAGQLNVQLPQTSVKVTVEMSD